MKFLYGHSTFFVGFFKELLLFLVHAIPGTLLNALKLREHIVYFTRH